MTNTIDAKAIIATEKDPIEDGSALGKYLVTNGVALRDLTIDVSGLPPEDLVSGFVNAILHEFEIAGLSIADAKEIGWTAKFPSESERISQLVAYYVDDTIGATAKPATTATRVAGR